MHDSLIQILVFGTLGVCVLGVIGYIVIIWIALPSSLRDYHSATNKRIAAIEAWLARADALLQAIETNTRKGPHPGE